MYQKMELVSDFGGACSYDFPHVDQEEALLFQFGVLRLNHSACAQDSINFFVKTFPAFILSSTS